MALTRKLAPTYHTNMEFYAVVDRLKIERAIPEELFQETNPFFNLPIIPKENEIRELFAKPQEDEPFKALLQRVSSLVSQEDCSSNVNTMTFAQVCLYKVLPCPQAHCPNRPREIVTHNQYKDHECQCPFYHHERDRRRIVLSLTNPEEFEYKANYFEEGRTQTDKGKYSQNFFESMFHPMYYKMFRCKVQHQHSDQFCPFYHTEQERSVWDKRFSDFMRKDRVTFVKDKQKYYENTVSSPESKQHLIYGNQSPVFYTQNKKKSKNNKNQGHNFQMTNGKVSEQYQKSSPTSGSSRKDSGDSFGLNTYSKQLFNYPQQMETTRVC